MAADDEANRITPGATVQQLYSSNVLGTGEGAKPDIVTQLSPNLTIIENSARTRLNFQYTPTFNHYDLGNSPDRIDQNLIASGRLTPFLDYLVIDVSAYATETGGSPNSVNSIANTLVPTNDRILFYLGTFEPHFATQFSDVATVDAYYRLKSANTSEQGGASSGPKPLSGNSLTHEAQLVIGSANSLGRMSAQLNLDHSQTTGTGQNNHEQTDADFIGLQYHVNHTYTLTGSIGYQRIHYDSTGSTAPFTSEGMTWSVGANYTPNPVSSASVSYGLRQGVYVPTIKIQYALGPRTTFSANYQVDIQNQLQSAVQDIRYLTFDAAGNPIDSRTGLPFVGLNSVFGTRNVLFRDKPLIVAISHQFTRSGLTFSATWERRQSITGFFAEDTAIGALLQYSREISPQTNCMIELGYTDHQTKGAVQNGAEHAQIINAGLALYYRLSDSTTLVLRETYVRKISSIPAFNLETNQAIIGLKKEF